MDLKLSSLSHFLKNRLAGILRTAGYELHRTERSARQREERRAKRFGRKKVARLDLSGPPMGGDDSGCCHIRGPSGEEVLCKPWRVSWYFEQVKEIRGRHVLEHLTLSQAGASLRDWMRALAIGGQLEVVVPNVDYHIKQWKQAEWNATTWRNESSDSRRALAGLWGWQGPAGPRSPSTGPAPTRHAHRAGFNRELLAFFLEWHGYWDVRCEARDRHDLVAGGTKLLDPSERQVAPTLDGIRADHKARYAFACGRIPQGANVLDVACGIGYGAWMIAERSSCNRVVGVEVNPHAVEYARKYYTSPRIEYVVADVQRMSFQPGTFDVAVSFETIEHLEDDRAFLGRVHASLKPGGLLLCGCPNQRVIPFDRGRFPFHRRHYTRRGLTELLRRTGFETQEVLSQADRLSTDFVAGDAGRCIVALARKMPLS
ncbi:MAG: methyltransferase domain-containing protein [Planctomycetota bacterium]